MTDEQDYGAIARGIVDGNLYLVLGTADEAGQPWVTPVYYASADYRDFYWVSAPDTQHSRNLAVRPQLSIVIFDSQAAINTGHLATYWPCIHTRPRVNVAMLLR